MKHRPSQPKPRTSNHPNRTRKLLSIGLSKADSVSYISLIHLSLTSSMTKKNSPLKSVQKLKDVTHIGSAKIMGQIWALLITYQLLNDTLLGSSGECWLCAPHGSNSRTSSVVSPIVLTLSLRPLLIALSQISLPPLTSPHLPLRYHRLL